MARFVPIGRMPSASSSPRYWMEKMRGERPRLCAKRVGDIPVVCLKRRLK